MGVKRIRKDSVEQLRKQKSTAQLQAENEALQAKVKSLETQLEDTQVALCDVYELMAGGGEALG